MSEQALALDPPLHVQGSLERIPLSIDMAPVLAPGETVVNPVATLTRMSDGSAYAGGIAVAPTVNALVVTLTLANLEPGVKYRLVVQFTAALGKDLAPYLLVECPF